MILRAFSLFFRMLLLLTLPTIALPREPKPPTYQSPQQPDSSVLHYDAILDWVAMIEEEEIDELYTPEQVENIAYFLSLLAWNGSPQDCPEYRLVLKQDMQSLLSELDPQSCQTIFCKSWVKKQCHGIKHFVKKHKTAIIIGAAVVVAVVAVVAIVAMSSTAAATSAVAAIGGAASEFGQNEPELPPAKIDAIEQALPILTAATLANTIEEHINPIKETLAAEAAALEALSSESLQNWSLAEKARTLGYD